MRFLSPLPPSYLPVAYLSLSFQELRDNTGIDFVHTGPADNTWHVAHCRIETVSMAFARRVTPTPSETVLFIDEVADLVPPVTRTLAKSAISQAGGSLGRLIWYDGDLLGELGGVPHNVKVKRNNPITDSPNPVFESTFTDFMSDSPLLPYRPPLR